MGIVTRVRHWDTLNPRSVCISWTRSS